MLKELIPEAPLVGGVWEGVSQSPGAETVGREASRPALGSWLCDRPALRAHRLTPRASVSSCSKRGGQQQRPPSAVTRLRGGEARERQSAPGREASGGKDVGCRQRTTAGPPSQRRRHKYEHAPKSTTVRGRFRPENGSQPCPGQGQTRLPEDGFCPRC